MGGWFNQLMRQNGAMIEEQVELTAAQLAALGGGSFPLLLAPGIGKAIILDFVALQMKFGGVAFVLGNVDNSFTFLYGSGVIQAINPFTLSGFMDQGQNTTVFESGFSPSDPTFQTDLENQPVKLIIDGTAPGLSAGNGSLIATIKYHILDLG